MPSVRPTSGDVDVDLGRLFSSLLRNWLPIVVVALVVAGSAFLLASLATPYYQAETRVTIERTEWPTTRQPDAGSDSRLFDVEGINTQIEIFTSTDLLKEVARKLNLADNPEFDDTKSPSLLKRLLIMAGLKGNPADIPAEERVLTKFRENLKVYRSEKTRTIVIEFSSESPQLAAEVPQVIAKTYMDFSLAAKQESNNAAEREQLESYLSRYREAQSHGSHNYLPVDALTVSDPVVPPEPYFPKSWPITGAALAATMLLMSIGILLSELFSGRAMRPAHGAYLEPVEQVQMPLFVPTVERKPAPRASVQPKELVEEEAYGEVSAHAAAEMLIAGGATRALFVSPEGDEAAASAVMVARDVADSGLRVLLVDLTAMGAASPPRLEGASLPGITDLLAGTAKFTDVIHADHCSDCHVIPVGNADQRTAMRAVERLPIIMNTLNAAYDVVIVECGPAGAGSIRRLVSEGTEVLVSALRPDDAVLAARDDLASSGYEGLTLVTPADYAPYPDRTAA